MFHGPGMRARLARLAAGLCAAAVLDAVVAAQSSQQLAAQSSQQLAAQSSQQPAAQSSQQPAAQSSQQPAAQSPQQPEAPAQPATLSPAAPRCRIGGRVTSGNVPLPGVSVVVHVGDALRAATSTDLDGTYTIL